VLAAAAFGVLLVAVVAVIRLSATHQTPSADGRLRIGPGRSAGQHHHREYADHEGHESSHVATSPFTVDVHPTRCAARLSSAGFSGREGS
jgi:hypothetical protein